MKISDESKIGIIAILAIAVLFFGFSFLKGKSLFKKEIVMYAVYDNVMGLKKSNKVVINGQTVGKITDIDGGRDMKQLTVTITYYRDLDIPVNSIASINPDLIGSTSLEIKLGDDPKLLKSGDTLTTGPSSSTIDEALKVLNPVLYEVKNAAGSLDSLLRIFSTLLDTSARQSLRSILTNVDLTTQNFVASSRSLQAMMDPNTGALTQTIQNTNKLTQNLNNNSGRIDSIMTNVQTASANFADVRLQPTIDSLQIAISSLKNIAAKMDKSDGSLGLLLNDDGLYNKLESATNKMNILMDDIRVHPERYINISIFGKKNKSNYLTAPLIDDTLSIITGSDSDTIKVLSH